MIDGGSEQLPEGSLSQVGYSCFLVVFSYNNYNAAGWEIFLITGRAVLM